MAVKESTTSPPNSVQNEVNQLLSRAIQAQESYLKMDQEQKQIDYIV